jgi:transcriptional regulator with XRE-family HTH domain
MCSKVYRMLFSVYNCVEELASPLMLKRLIKGLSQEDLAEALGVSRQTISAWENGRKEPHLSFRQIKKLCNLLDYTLETLPDDFGPQPIHPSSPFYGRRATDRTE